jgi:D-alanyl-D-alanine carboxypeptidase
MQSWSQQIDPTRTEQELRALGSRLTLPTGWSYTTRTLTASLRIVTTNTPALVLQDKLGNSYSLETEGG